MGEPINVENIPTIDQSFRKETPVVVPKDEADRFYKPQNTDQAVSSFGRETVMVSDVNAELYRMNQRERQVLMDIRGINGVPKFLGQVDAVIDEESGLKRYITEIEEVKGKTLDKVEIKEIMAIELLKELGRIAGDIYKRGYIYNDFKLGNILIQTTHPDKLWIDKQDKIWLIDFNYAEKYDIDGNIASNAGTPPYMPPEKEGVDGKIDVRSDIYSLSAVIAKKLGATLKKEFIAPNVTPKQAREREIISLDNLNVSRKLRLFLGWNLIEDPRYRCQNWDEFSELLEKVKDNSVSDYAFEESLNNRASVKQAKPLQS